MNPQSVQEVGYEMSRRYGCGECGQLVEPTAYHPHLYCVLWKAGIRDQAAYLAASGWRRVDDPA